MDPVLYVVAMVSFLLGSFGYVTVRFILMPIGRYGRLKRRIRRIIAPFTTTDDGASSQPVEPPGNDVPEKLRRISTELSDCYTDHLPHWYRLYLEGRRNESPLDAAKLLMNLSNTRNSEHARRQVERIQQCLNLK